jgi:hypothetical protein
MSQSTNEYEKLVKALERVSIQQDSTEIRTTILDDCLPSDCDVALTMCGEEQMSQLLLRLLDVARDCINRVKDEAATLQDHGARALVCYSLEKLCHDGYSLLHVIGAIALEHSRSSPALIVDGWKAASITDVIPSKAVDQINDDAIVGEMGFGFGDCEVRGRSNPFLQKRLITPLNRLYHFQRWTRPLEEALCVAYDTFMNSLDAEHGLFEAAPAAVLAIYALQHLSRLGYDRDLAIHAIAVTDHHGLLGDAGQSREAAWWATLIEYPEDIHESVKDAWNAAQVTGTMKDLEMST